MRTKKFLSVLLTLLMMAGVIAVAPITASAAAPPASGMSWEFLATTPDETNVAYGGGTYSWVQSTKTLTLNSVSHSTTA